MSFYVTNFVIQLFSNKNPAFLTLNYVDYTVTYTGHAVFKKHALLLRGTLYALWRMENDALKDLQEVVNTQGLPPEVREHICQLKLFVGVHLPSLAVSRCTVGVCACAYTVLALKTPESALFHTLIIFSVILHAIGIYIRHTNMILEYIDDNNDNTSHDFHVMIMAETVT